ncbi:hypothetical protein OTB20_17325 [Streptomyces sp. H27-H1]|uniref:hypothetical protein n=1 Tax=Streptomyces sp. H27-H1 TaxID=2996461 RepID=UPI00227181BB|nr:hypothetical protein [Streptomyces sp. H27-H1]MCY0927938.1 hypothetical protein [Streptomyces sp. H27-H1]
MRTAKGYPERGAALWLGRMSTVRLPFRRWLRGVHWAAGGQLLYNAVMSIRIVVRVRSRP